MCVLSCLFTQLGWLIFSINLAQTPVTELTLLTA